MGPLRPPPRCWPKNGKQEFYFFIFLNEQVCVILQNCQTIELVRCCVPEGAEGFRKYFFFNSTLLFAAVSNETTSTSSSGSEVPREADALPTLQARLGSCKNLNSSTLDRGLSSTSPCAPRYQGDESGGKGWPRGGHPGRGRARRRTGPGKED